MQIQKIIKKQVSAIFSLMLIAVTILMIIKANETAIHVIDSLKLCIRSIIPSVFPFLVISNIISGSSVSKYLGRIFSRPLKFLFGCSYNASSPIILGTLCGFPVGAISAMQMWKRKMISKKEAQRLLLFINNPSIPFVIGSVGISMYNSKKLGIVIYVCIILSAVTIGIFTRLFNSENYVCEEALKSSDESKGILNIIQSSLSQSALNMLCICACVVFFSSVSGVILSLENFSFASDELKAIIKGIFEISSGAKQSTYINDRTISLIICTFICAFSGISVQMQIISICEDLSISYMKFFFAKLCQGIIASIYIYIYLRLFAKSDLIYCSYDYSFHKVIHYLLH